MERGRMPRSASRTKTTITKWLLYILLNVRPRILKRQSLHACQAAWPGLLAGLARTLSAPPVPRTIPIRPGRPTSTTAAKWAVSKPTN